MSHKTRTNLKARVVMGSGLFLLVIGCIRLIAAASSLPASTIMTVTGVILMILTFFLSQNIIRPHRAITGAAEIPCSACNDTPRPGVLFCQICGRELTPSPLVHVIPATSSSPWWGELSPRFLAIIILLLFLSLIFGWA